MAVLFHPFLLYIGVSQDLDLGSWILIYPSIQALRKKNENFFILYVPLNILLNIFPTKNILMITRSASPCRFMKYRFVQSKFSWFHSSTHPHKSEFCKNAPVNRDKYFCDQDLNQRYLFFTLSFPSHRL